MRKLAISDIHGCSETFRALLDKIGFSTADKLYLLGDYVDRGPDSKGVIDRILALQKQGYKIQCLLGNHDQAMLDARRDVNSFYYWLDRFKGNTTLDSFEADSVQQIPARYWEFFDSLELHLEIDEYILVHAGLDWENKDNPLANKEELLFGRHWYDKIDYDWLGGRIIIHGHTPVYRNEIEKDLTQLSKNRYLNIDNGCVYAHRMDPRRNLCAFDMTSRKIFFHRNIDAVQL